LDEALKSSEHHLLILPTKAKRPAKSLRPPTKEGRKHFRELSEQPTVDPVNYRQGMGMGMGMGIPPQSSGLLFI